MNEYYVKVMKEFTVKGKAVGSHGMLDFSIRLKDESIVKATMTAEGIAKSLFTDGVVVTVTDVYSY